MAFIESKNYQRINSQKIYETGRQNHILQQFNSFWMEICGYTKTGCFIRPFLPHAAKDDKINSIPLKSSDYQVEIVNTIANVTLVQTYINPSDKFLEVQYNFPVNPSACVYRFFAEFGNKRIEGVIKQKSEAEKQYKEAIKGGKQAALGQLNSQRNDILNLQVGNLGPKQMVKIQITYLQELTLSYNMFYEFHMSGTISPSYMNHIPREVMKTALRNEVAKSSGAYYWNFKITLKSSRKVNFFDSKTHDIQLVYQNDSQTQLKLTMTSASIPNKDFVFTYTTQDYHLPSYVLGRTDFSSTAVISFIPKFCDLGINDAYKASVTGTHNQTDIENARGQYIFLLDRSGSMKGTRIEKAKESLILFIKSLPQDIYFNVISFGNGYRTLFPSSVKYHDRQIQKAVYEVRGMNADMGGTEIYAPLESLLAGKPIEGYPKQIFLLTDGAVSNTKQILDLVEVKSKYSRVHTIGIGNGASEDLVIGCAKMGRGHHTFITDRQNPSSKIIKLLTKSLSPVITKMNLIFDKNVVQSIIPNPDSLPYILKDEIVNFYINFKGQLSQKTKIQFSYKDSLNNLPYGVQIQIDPQSSNESFIDRMGQFKKIKVYESSYRHNTDLPEQMYYVKDVLNKRTEVINLSVRSQILSEHTAFICVQKELIDGKFLQVASKGQIKVQVENVKPVEYQAKQGAKLNGMPVDLKRSKLLSMPLKKSCINKFEDMTAPELKYRAHKDKVQQKINQKWELEMCDESKQDGEIEQKNQRFNTQILLQIKKPAKNLIKKDAKSQNLINAQAEIDSKKKRQKAPTISLKPSEMKTSIDEIISYQLSDGSWIDVRLIEKLLGAPTLKKISKQGLNPILITFLVVKWIQKHFPQVQYSLVVKKGLNFIKRKEASMEQLGVFCEEIKI